MTTHAALHTRGHTKGGVCDPGTPRRCGVVLLVVEMGGACYGGLTEGAGSGRCPRLLGEYVNLEDKAEDERRGQHKVAHEREEVVRVLPIPANPHITTTHTIRTNRGLGVRSMCG